MLPFFFAHFGLKWSTVIWSRYYVLCPPKHKNQFLQSDKSNGCYIGRNPNTKMTLFSQLGNWYDALCTQFSGAILCQINSRLDLKSWRRIEWDLWYKLKPRNYLNQFIRSKNCYYLLDQDMYIKAYIYSIPLSWNIEIKSVI